MHWIDLFKIFQISFEADPQTKKQSATTGAGRLTSEVPYLKNDPYGGGSSTLRIGGDTIDFSNLQSRSLRLDEYERLRGIPEIEKAMTVIADEACVAGDTIVSTLFDGDKTIQWLAENKADEDFYVYSYDFEQKEYTLALAYNPRKVGTQMTYKVILDDGTEIIATPDHLVLLKDGRWSMVNQLKHGDHLMPFYRLPANQNLSRQKKNQFPRIFSTKNGWVHERQFINDWKNGKSTERYEKLNKVCRFSASGLKVDQIAEIMGTEWINLRNLLRNEGFSFQEIQWLGQKKPFRRVLSVKEHKELDVYDLSVKDHKNFCSNSVVFHNCQKNEDDNIFSINVKNSAVKKELEYLMFNRKMLNLNRKINGWFKRLCINGDLFLEIIIMPDKPKKGILNAVELAPELMFRLESTKGKLFEFQQAQDKSQGPDEQALLKNPVDGCTDEELIQTNVIRFRPEQIVHIRLGEQRKTFYPYGLSLIEPARSPALQLKLMEDSMVVYRLSRAPERKIFYIDTQQVPPFKIPNYIARLQDLLKKRKVARSGDGASGVDEKWSGLAVDDDIWLPTRQGSSTRIETLPGACLSLDTEIPLLDGTNDTLAKLIERWDNGEEMWAYSCNPETGEVVPGLITWAGVTRKNAKVVKVTLDNGESVICTPDHKFPVIGREGKIEAQNLNVGDSLIPFNTRKQKIKKNTNDYKQVYDSCLRKWIFAHRLVANYFERQEMVYSEKYRYSEKTIIHHKDFDRFNNNPNNLFWMNWEDHLKLHQDAPNTPETKAKISKALKKYHISMSKDKKQLINKRLKGLSILGNNKLGMLLKNDQNFKQKFSDAQKKGWEKAVKENPKLHENRGSKISNNNKERFSDPAYKAKVFDKQTIQYPDSMFEYICEGFRQGIKVEELISQINKNQKLINEYVEINKHLVRKTIKLDQGLTTDHFDKLIKNRGFTGTRQLRKHLTGNLNGTTGNGKMYGKATLNFPKKIFSYFMHRLADNVKNVDTILTEINNNKELMQEWFQANTDVARKKIDLNQGIKRTHVLRMINNYGYKDLEHARKEAAFYNHTVVSVEFLEETQDVGTITIDGHEKYHNFHTFALNKSSIFVYNSNLGEIDDTVYFRNKLYIALNLPENYFTNQDVNTTRITLSAQNANVARMIARLQESFEDGLYEIADRHLKLRGFPEEMYEDLKIKMTPPSEWQELSKAEVINQRLNVAGQYKSQLLMSDRDILIKILKYSEEETEELLSRMNIQKLQDARLQILVANPAIAGVGVPGQGEEQMGVEAGAGGMGNIPAPDAAMDGMGGGQPDPTAAAQPPIQPVANANNQLIQPNQTPLEEPTPEEIRKYDLEISSNNREREDVDYSEEM